MDEKKPKNGNKQKSPLKNWAIFTGIALEMGASIFGCAWLGKKLDANYGNLDGTHWFTLGLILFGVAGSLYIVLQQLKKLNN